jgi:hypothetical protein
MKDFILGGLMALFICFVVFGVNYLTVGYPI